MARDSWTNVDESCSETLFLFNSKSFEFGNGISHKVEIDGGYFGLPDRPKPPHQIGEDGLALDVAVQEIKLFVRHRNRGDSVKVLSRWGGKRYIMSVKAQISPWWVTWKICVNAIALDNALLFESDWSFADVRLFLSTALHNQNWRRFDQNCPGSYRQW